LTEFQKNK